MLERAHEMLVEAMESGSLLEVAAAAEMLASLGAARLAARAGHDERWAARADLARLAERS